MTPDPQNDADADIYAADVVEHLALVGETDARKWAATFVDTVARVPEIPRDPATMLAWFAVAIEAGRDAASRVGGGL